MLIKSYMWQNRQFSQINLAQGFRKDIYFSNCFEGVGAFDSILYKHLHLKLYFVEHQYLMTIH